MTITSPGDLTFTLKDLAPMPRSRRVLLTTPTHFEVRYVINPHMAGHEGSVDAVAAQAEWDGLRDAYADLGLTVRVLDGQHGLPDMVFCANQTLPFGGDDDRREVVLSRMCAPERAPEVAHFRAFFEAEGYRVHTLPESCGTFEGMGDALWHPGRAMLWGGHGFRTDARAYAFLSDLWDLPVLLLSLHDPDFYHLDTCLSLLDETTALYYPGAFDEDGRALLESFFDRLIEAPEKEAREGFACNAHCPDGRHVLIHDGCPETMRRLREAGFTPVPLSTREFLKAGGSVFCMKQMIF